MGREADVWRAEMARAMEGGLSRGEAASRLMATRPTLYLRFMLEANAGRPIAAHYQAELARLESLVNLAPIGARARPVLAGK